MQSADEMFEAATQLWEAGDVNRALPLLRAFQ